MKMANLKQIPPNAIIKLNPTNVNRWQWIRVITNTVKLPNSKVKHVVINNRKQLDLLDLGYHELWYMKYIHEHCSPQDEECDVNIK